MNAPTLPDYYVVPTCLEEIGILYADEHLLMINKPAFLLSVPGRAPENQDSVLGRLQRQYGDMNLVHRLDLDTSGIMAFARTKPAQSALSRAFQQRTVLKTYEAIVDGIVEEDQGQIDLPLIADWPRRPLQKVCYESGKHALTYWHVLHRDYQKGTTRLRLKPVTGRSHQLRIHCRELGHPILGCDMYAPRAIEYGSPRLMLHAHSIAFNHPVTGLWQTFTSPVPF